MLINGFIFKKHRAGSHSVPSSWRCQQSSCTAKLRLNNNTDDLVSHSTHNHVAVAGKAQANVALQEMKTQAAQSFDKPSQIQLTVSRSTRLSSLGSSASRRQLPKEYSGFERHKVHGVHRVPLSALTTVADVVMSLYFDHTHRGDNFLPKDSDSADPRRGIMFGTKDNVQVFARSNTWLCDGTFSVVPTLWAQLYTIHAIVHEAVLPCTYILLMEKSKAYMDVFGELRTIIRQLGPEYANYSGPRMMLIDFEKRGSVCVAFIAPRLRRGKEKIADVVSSICGWNFTPLTARTRHFGIGLHREFLDKCGVDSLDYDIFERRNFCIRMTETQVVIGPGSSKPGQPTVQVHTFRKADQFSGPVERNISWEIAADGKIVHKNYRYYCCVVWGVLWRSLLGITAVYMIVIGSIYLIDCRVDKRIPLYMIVGGVALLPIFLLAVYMIKKDRVFEGLWKLIGSFICSPIILFAIIWTIVGGVWTFGAASVVELQNHESPQYCHPVLFVSSAVSVILIFLLLCIFLFISIRYFRRGVQRGMNRN
ncbi:hypothetical protein BV898_02164 [Hypsibius exemplaris]|uniref:Uncharacterized protein n=1 Tax=Hypsibius exemplaris TaxID=2072580 RepID=A0A1W0X920_HYPEX|nr:hypothetical protein BV898_02164 [Hypsibius exemplaris]